MDENMVVAREEIFDPVLGVASISGLEAGTDWINPTNFANTASLFTECGFEARRSHDRVDSGNLAVNAGSAAPVPFLYFGGLNDSFFGDLHTQGDDAVRFIPMGQYISSSGRTRWTDGSCSVAFGLPGGRRRQSTAHSGSPERSDRHTDHAEHHERCGLPADPVQCQPPMMYVVTIVWRALRHLWTYRIRTLLPCPAPIGSVRCR